MESRLRLFWLLLILLTGLLCFGFACGDDDDDDDSSADDDDSVDDDDDTVDDDDDDDDDNDDDDDDNDDDDTVSFADFFPPDPGPLGTYRINGFSNYWDVPAVIVGQDTTTYPGLDLTVISFGDFSKAGTAGAILWVDLNTVRNPGIKAMEGYEESREDGWAVREIFDDVLYMDFSGDVGDIKTSSVSGTMEFSDAPDVDFDLALDTTLVSNDTTTVVPYGTVEHCIQVLAEFYDPAYPTARWGGDFFYHDIYAFVEAAVFPIYDVVELVDPAN